MGKSRQKVQNIELRNNTEIITNPQQISQKFNSFFTEKIVSLKMSNNLFTKTFISKHKLFPYLYVYFPSYRM